MILHASGSGVDSSQDCNTVNRVLFDMHRGQTVPGLIQFWMKF